MDGLLTGLMVGCQVMPRRYAANSMTQALDELLNEEDLAVPRVRTVDHVADRLRAMIADGRLPQGEHLREMPLAKAFSVSRTTIRDAIALLASDGLVTRQFHRGAIVTVLSEDDIIEIYRVRRLLELSALARVENGDPGLTVRLESSLDACETAARSGSYSVFVQRELEFHAALVGFHDSPRLNQFFSTVLRALRLALSVLADDQSEPTPSNLAQRYRNIFVAARRGDVETATRELTAHLDSYETRLRSGAPRGDERSLGSSAEGQVANGAIS